MGLYEHNKRRLARLDNTRPVHGKIQQILKDGKREQLLQGVDWRGRPFAPLKPSTLKRRKGSGPPLSPRRGESRSITHYYVLADQVGPGQLRVEADWHVPWMRHHNTGTKNKDGTQRMAARPAGGFRSQDVKKVLAALRRWVMEGEA
jgi:hypothetical protein